jgi:uncharacterized OsmC-like protein
MSQDTKKIPKLRNGVDVIALKETIGAIKGQSDLAKFKFRATNKWINCGHNQARIEGFYGCNEEIAHKKPFVFDADEPAVLLGDDKGANPVEYVLVALSACVTTAVAYHAAARGIIIESIESSLEGDIDLRGFLGISDEVPKGYQDIRVTMTIKSDASPEQLKELAGFSPVFDTLKRAIPVEVEVKPG